MCLSRSTVSSEVEAIDQVLSLILFLMAPLAFTHTGSHVAHVGLKLTVYISETILELLLSLPLLPE